jgi:hypothetical protein
MTKKISDNKRARFEKLAVYRTNEVLNKLKVLGNCANRSAYEYSEEDVNKIFNEIDRSVKETKAKFHFSKKRKEFTL